MLVRGYMQQLLFQSAGHDAIVQHSLFYHRAERFMPATGYGNAAPLQDGGQNFYDPSPRLSSCSSQCHHHPTLQHPHFICVSWKLAIEGLIALQIVVVLLEPLQDAGEPQERAIAVLEEVIGLCEEHLPARLKTLPPLPRCTTLCPCWLRFTPWQHIVRCTQILPGTLHSTAVTQGPWHHCILKKAYMQSTVLFTTAATACRACWTVELPLHLASCHAT